MPIISDTATIILTNKNAKNIAKIGDRIFALDYEKSYNSYPKLILEGKNDIESKDNALYIIQHLEFYKFIDNSDCVIPKNIKKGKHYICGLDFEKFTGKHLSDYCS